MRVSVTAQGISKSNARQRHPRDVCGAMQERRTDFGANVTQISRVLHLSSHIQWNQLLLQCKQLLLQWDQLLQCNQPRLLSPFQYFQHFRMNMKIAGRTVARPVASVTTVELTVRAAVKVGQPIPPNVEDLVADLAAPTTHAVFPCLSLSLNRLDQRFRMKTKIAGALVAVRVGIVTTVEQRAPAAAKAGQRSRRMRWTRWRTRQRSSLVPCARGGSHSCARTSSRSPE